MKVRKFGTFGITETKWIGNGQKELWEDYEI
jgi:hypothetical protein